MKQSLSVFLLIFFSVLTSAQVTQEWVKRYNTPPFRQDYSKFVKLDGAGNIYVSGESVAGDTTIIIIKYNSSGTVKWQQSYPGARTLAYMNVDSPGNVYITVHERGTGSDYDYVNVKYNTDGILQWIARYNGPANRIDVATSAAVDALGNLYVTGRSLGGGPFSGAVVKYNSSGILQWVHRDEDYVATGLYITLDGLGNIYTAGQHEDTTSAPVDFFTVKYNSSGVKLWEKILNVSASTYSEPKGIMVDNINNVIITGRVDLPFLKHDYYTFKYSSDGVLQWEADYDGAGQEDFANDIGLDAFGNIYVTGSSVQSLSHPPDCVTLKYNTNGVQQWVRRFGSGEVFNIGFTLSVDAAGNSYVSGVTKDDYLTIKYSSAGVQRWVQTYSGAGASSDLARSNAVDESGNVYVTGSSFSTNSDFATIKYSQESSFSSFIRDKIEMIRLKVDSLVTSQIIPPDKGAMLNNNLQSAADQYSQGHTNAALAKMNIFKLKVNLFVRQQVIPPQTAQALIADADEVIGLMQQGGNGNSVQIEEKKSFSLQQNFPNPFNPVTKISFEIPFGGNVTLKIYDITGREIASLADGYMDAGSHEAVWNASNYSSGVYFYSLISEAEGQKFEKTMKMMLVK